MKGTVSEIILKKIEEKEEDRIIKEFVSEILQLERRNLLTSYPRFSEDYDNIISKYLMRMKK